MAPNFYSVNTSETSEYNPALSVPICFSKLGYLNSIPKHWKLRRLKNVVDMRISNVDKHVRENETSIRLCNYVDVYKNAYIHDKLNFMQATATAAEIQRFRLEKDDVLITKDSETWDDIGVPALVTESAFDLVSGYHLALLRPRTDQIVGGYLHYALQSRDLAYQFHIEAKGVTRYGLTHAGLKSVQVPLPPLPQQHAIVCYLDHANRNIRRYIDAKQRLIGLLEEQRRAVVQQAVTCGLDPGVPLRHSGISWLGDVPVHWEVRSIKTLFREKDQRSGDGQGVLLSLTREHGIVPHAKVATRMASSSDLSKYKVCLRGDLVMNRMQAWSGMFSVSSVDGLVSPDYSIFVPTKISEVCVKFFEYLFRIPMLVGEFAKRSKGIGSGFNRLYTPDFGGVLIAAPPIFEQHAIVKYLDKATASIDTAIERTRRQIELMEEYRTRLISDVVTGKLDVREAAAQLPEHLEQADSSQ